MARSFSKKMLGLSPTQHSSSERRSGSWVKQGCSPPAQLVQLPAPSAASLTPKGTLQRGSKGSAVTELQNLLVHIGLLDSTDVDGKFGPKTEAAVKKYQALRNLKVDGKVGAITLASLKAEP